MLIWLDVQTNHCELVRNSKHVRCHQHLPPSHQLLGAGVESLGLTLLFVSLISSVSAHTGEDEYGHHMMGDMYGMMSGSYGGGGMFFGWITGLLIVIVLVLLIVWLIKQIQKK